MVRDVNETQVAPEDKLTYSVYHYESKDKVFELAEKFFERQNERDAEELQADTDVHETGKKSILEQLEKGKEECAAHKPKEAVSKDTKIRSDGAR